jgi:hypothetical protein
MVANGGYVDVTAEDGTVVLRGDILDVRDRVIFNYHFYGEPIIHPSARPACADFISDRAQKAMAYLNIAEAMDERKLDFVPLEEDRCEVLEGGPEYTARPRAEELNSDSAEALLGCAMPSDAQITIKEESVSMEISDPKEALIDLLLTTNFQTQYRFVHSNLYKAYTCILHVGNAVARGQAFTKDKARDNAAAKMVRRIKDGKGPDMDKKCDVHGPIDLVSLYEPSPINVAMGGVKQETVDAWGKVNIMLAYARFRKDMSLQLGEYDVGLLAGSPRTCAPRSYGLCLNTKRRRLNTLLGIDGFITLHPSVSNIPGFPEV